MYYNQTELDPEKFMKDAEYLYYFKNLELNHEKKNRNRKLETVIALQINTKGSSHFCSVLINRVEAASGGVCPMHLAAGQQPYLLLPQKGFIISHTALVCFWNRMVQYHLSSSPPCI